ncbi:hypothetical protein NDU88_005222 [Pleurodeles waltl]|uniref:Uncharacterized protein n=1 Tax=Pleurodeles waltl TaxID=8319 RepID=A0AAV7TVZ2_PLEWA|nr:hypothetical protein NDU88_005222 [Pleurodeles waltl]
MVVLRRSLILLGLDPRCYGTHSFRIGAATEAKALGCVGGPDGGCSGFSFLLHENLVTSAVELFRQDGVPLTFMGNDLYLLDLRIMIADSLGEKLWDR